MFLEDDFYQTSCFLRKRLHYRFQSNIKYRWTACTTTVLSAGCNEQTYASITGYYSALRFPSPVGIFDRFGKFSCRCKDRYKSKFILYQIIETGANKKWWRGCLQRRSFANIMIGKSSSHMKGLQIVFFRIKWVVLVLLVWRLYVLSSSFGTDFSHWVTGEGKLQY